MKNYILIVLVFITSLISAQKSLFVEYKVAIANENIFKNNPYLRQFFDKAIINAKHLQFGLICKKDESFFYLIEKLSNDTNNSIKPQFINYSGEIYQEKDTIYKYSNLLGNNTYLKKPAKINWKLASDKKVIDGYECYKATSEYIVNGITKTFRHPVIAWYCPQIPHSFGPNGYSGLPGLILELQVRNVTFGVETINLKSEKDFKINKNTMKVLSETEFNKELDKFNDFTE